MKSKKHSSAQFLRLHSVVDSAGNSPTPHINEKHKKPLWLYPHLTLHTTFSILTFTLTY